MEAVVVRGADARVDEEEAAVVEGLPVVRERGLDLDLGGAIAMEEGRFLLPFTRVRVDMRLLRAVVEVGPSTLEAVELMLAVLPVFLIDAPLGFLLNVGSTFSPCAMLRRALLAAVVFTIGATMLILAGTGLALNTFFLRASSSSRFDRSSRCALSFCAIASPGSVKVERVGGLVDFVGTKGALVIEETRSLAATLGFVATDEARRGVAALDGVFLIIHEGAFMADLVVIAGAPLRVERLAGVLSCVALVLLATGSFLELSTAFFGVDLTLVDSVLAGVFFDFRAFIGESSPSLRCGRDSSTFSMASSRASIASTESSIRPLGLRGVLILIFSTKESSLASTLS